MKRFTTFLILFAFLLTATAFAGHHWHKKYHWWKNEDMMKELNVSEAQLSQINKIDEDYKEKFEKLHDNLMVQKDSLKAMLNDPKSSNDQLTAKYNEKLAAKNELKALKFQKKLAIRNVLNDDQIVKLGALKEKKWKDHKRDCSSKDCKKGCSYKNKK